MAGREKHKQRSQRSYILNRSSFAYHARQSIGRAGEKQQRKNFFEGIKSAFTKMFKKTKEG